MNPAAGGSTINERNILSNNMNGPPSALKIVAKVNVMDVIADAVAIRSSLLRCAQVSLISNDDA